MPSILTLQQKNNIILSSIPRKQYMNNAIQSMSPPSSHLTRTLTLMPSKFRNADGDSSFSLGRKQFLKTDIVNKHNNINDLIKDFEKEGYDCKKNCSHSTCTKNSSTSQTKGKYIRVQTSEQRIQRIKNEAIGRGTLGVLNEETGRTELSLQGLTNKETKINVQQQQLRKIRNRGSVVPTRVVSNRNARCY